MNDDVPVRVAGAIPPAGRPAAALALAALVGLVALAAPSTPAAEPQRANGEPDKTKPEPGKVDGLAIPPVRPLQQPLSGDKSKLPGDPTMAFSSLAGVVRDHSLYFDARRKKPPTPPKGPYGGLGMLLGLTNGNEETHQAIDHHSRYYDALGTVQSPYLRRAAGEFYGNALARMQLAEANDLLGNSPAAAIRQGYDLMRKGIKYEFSRDADVAELRESLQDKFPGYRVVVTDAPLSEDSQKHLGDLLRGVGSLKADMQNQVMVSILLDHADMAQSDRAAQLWEKWLLPLAKKRGGPAAKEPPVALAGVWKRIAATDPSVLQEIRLKTTARQELSGVSLAVELENEWGDKVTGYYFAGTVAAGTEVIPLAHLNARWAKRVARYSNTIKVKWSVWSDQATYEGGTLELKNPTPNARAESLRREDHKYNAEDRAKGEALGAFLRKTPLVPFNPNRVARRLMETLAEGSQFVFKHPTTKTPVVLHTLSQDWRAGELQFALLDAKTGKPLDPAAAKVGGKAGIHREVGAVVALDNKWQLFLGYDEQPLINFPSTAGNEINTVSMMPLLKGTPPEFDAIPWPPPRKAGTTPAPTTPPVPKTGDMARKPEPAGGAAPDKDGRVAFNGKLYKYFPEVVTWTEAKEKCEKLGGHLAVVTGKEENAFLTKMVLDAKAKETWLGGTNVKDKKTWAWVNGAPFKYTNWEKTQPNNKGGVEHYLLLWAVRNGEWSDQPDRAQGHSPGYVCEWKAPAAADKPDPLQAGSVWVEGARKLTVVERTGNTFKGTFAAGTTIERHFTGTVEGSTIAWRSKDVTAVKGGAGGNNTGVLDEAGTTINFSWEDGRIRGTFSLRLQKK